MNPPGSADPPSSGSPHASSARPAQERRALWAGFAVSFVLHLLVLLVYAIGMGRFSPPDPALELPEPDRPHEGTEVVVILEVPEVDMAPVLETDLEEPEPDPDELEALEPDEAPPVVPPAVPDADEEEADEPSIAERLQPRMTDPRLWAPVDPHHTELTDQERAELLLRGMIQSWNDSVAVAAALSEGARDWTYTDDDGRRWGLSPGRIHLGDFSVPLPFSFTVPPGRWLEARERAWVLEDLARGAAAAEVRETWAERARVIRERMEAERSQGSAG